MKKVFKILKFTVLSVLVIVLIVLGFLWFSPIPSYEKEAISFKVVSDSAKIEEGARIASMLCVSCHQSSDGKFGGGRVVDANDFGEIYAPNITHSPKSKMNDYTDGELAYLIRTGIKRDGQYAPPYMPKLPHLSNYDLECIIAFLRSDHPYVQASDNTWPDSKPNLLTKFLVRVAFKPFPYPNKDILGPDTNNQVEFGKYVSLAKFECFSCHSKDFKSNDYLNPDKSVGFFGGGNPFKQADGKIVYSSNLTMDETGLGKWKEADFIKAVKFGIRPNGVPTHKPMLPYTRMTDQEASAVWAYLSTLTKISNDIKALKN